MSVGRSRRYPLELRERAVRMVVDGIVDAVDGTKIPVSADTLLVHGDNADAVRNATAIRRALIDAGVEIASLPEVLADRSAPSAASCP